LRALTRAVAALVVLLGNVQPANAQDRFSKFRDPDDGAFDISAHLATSFGFLPMAMPVTEPAVGYGAVGALAFMHRPKGWDIDEARAAFEARERIASPSVSAAFGMYTTSDSWAAGGAHLGLWGENRWRYLGAATAMRLNLSISGEGLGGEERLFEYGVEGWAVTQNLRYRVGRSDFWVGALFNYMHATTVFTEDRLPDLDPLESDADLASLGLTVRFDNRSNTFTPDRGVFADISVRRLDEFIGSDFEYWSATGSLLGYIDPTEDLVLGLRVEASTVGDDAPFWAKPAVNIRGVARGRYTGDSSGVIEGEVRWDLTGRWSAVGFGGAGWTAKRDEPGAIDRWVGAGGTGFRYLLARAFGLRGGVDVAYGNDGWAFYMTMGSAWGGV